MNHLPSSFLVVLAFVTLAVGLIFYFVSRRFLFLICKKNGKDSIARNDYKRAITLLSASERLWGFNVAKQTIPSFENDLAMLDEIYNDLYMVSRSVGVDLDVTECRECIKAVQSEIQCNIAPGKRLSGNKYVAAVMRLKSARYNLRSRLRQIAR